MPDLNPNDPTHSHIVTPTEFEQETLIKRRKLYAEADKELARDWVLKAQEAKAFRKQQEALSNSDHADTDTSLGRAYMTFPATLWKRLENRFGADWHKDKKLKKKVWDMYPEFRLRSKF